MRNMPRTLVQDRGRSRLDAYLQDPVDVCLPAHLAARSHLPSEDSHPPSVSSEHFHHAGTPPLTIATSKDRGTSLLLQGSNATSNDSLPGLASESDESEYTESVASSMGVRELNRRQRFLDWDGSVQLQSSRSLPQLECPFRFLSCHVEFNAGSYDNWYRHGLTHFQDVEPPRVNQCCFCDKEFTASTGSISWQKRSKHVAMHHLLGHSLAHARADFKLYEHLWCNHVLSTVGYRELMVSGARGL